MGCGLGLKGAGAGPRPRSIPHSASSSYKSYQPFAVDALRRAVLIRTSMRTPSACPA